MTVSLYTVYIIFDTFISLFIVVFVQFTFTFPTIIAHFGL